MGNVGALCFRVAVAGMVVGMSASTAHAYLDPGTGSILLQLLLGGAAGLAIAGKLYWHKFIGLIGGRRQAAKGELSLKESEDADDRSRR